ncbi:aminotransferase class V-fold PLP-dependent enzyme [Nitratireductor sp. ZSWI3]|uniref:aminotransferase class V-fold PLP-dependent enzyme n=1 Tax=Nitratireductor sp. ZSWI3 TaxID=2966359 RepID=UPI00214F93A8|nr:aminotransferase class V-fold PLP-dependent enzyme [Nitratireductor sp. ZSWI3]MCR4267160.1 aminotransferase class V-fold PLP-dependent enzyme [Nitratireductor sp. ZSWI3]
MSLGTNADASAYLLYHSIGMYPGKAEEMAAALSAFSAGWGRPDNAQWARALALRQEFIDLWRDLIGAPAGTLTTSENVTTALHSLVGALPEEHLKGRRLLIAGDCFPSMHFLLTGLSARYGFTLDTVPLRPGESWVRDEDVIARWGSDVGLALLTHVTSTSSHRCDLPALVAHGRKIGSLIGVDITQAAGLLPYDVLNPMVDFSISTSLKWLCATPGAGILHVAEPLIRACRPELRGWFSQEDIFSWDLEAFAYANDARRFDNGTPSILACAGSVPALRWHARQDMAQLLAHNRKLAAGIIDTVKGLRLKLVSPEAEAERGGSVMVRLPDRIDPVACVARLAGRGICADHRSQILRLSPGVMTTEAGTERLAEALHAAL